MSISSTTIISSSMTASQDRLAKLVYQLSSGKRIQTPSDDPVGAAQALITKEKVSIAETQQKTADYALSILGIEESLVASMQDTLMDAHVEGVYSGNGGLSSLDITAMGLKVMGLYNSMMDAYNAGTPSGPAFSGYGGASPFSTGATGPVYTGSSGKMAVQVSDSEVVDIRGDATALSGNPPRDALQAVWDLGQQLITGAGATSAQLGNLENALDALGELRSSLGGRMAQVDSAKDRAGSKIERYAELISRVEDLDYAEALGQLEKETALQEALGKVFQKTASMSLMNYI